MRVIVEENGKHTSFETHLSEQHLLMLIGITQNDTHINSEGLVEAHVRERNMNIYTNIKAGTYEYASPFSFEGKLLTFDEMWELHYENTPSR